MIIEFSATYYMNSFALENDDNLTNCANLYFQSTDSDTRVETGYELFPHKNGEKSEEMTLFETFTGKAFFPSLDGADNFRASYLESGHLPKRSFYFFFR